MDVTASRPTLQATASSSSSSASSKCLNGAGLSLIKSFEGFRAKVYRDSAGIPTIGYGTLCSSGLLPCTRAVTEAEAAAALAKDVTRRFAPCVKKYVRAPVNSNQFSALVSFAYNVGCGSLQSVASATGLNTAKPNFRAVAGRMAQYNKARVNGRLTVLPGLVRRRAAEGALFNNAKVTTGCAVRPTLSSSRNDPRSRRAGKAPSKKKKARKLFSTIFGTLTRGKVDLPEGTMVYIPPHMGTDLPVKIKADIATDVREHDAPIRKNRGPIGRLPKKKRDSW